jgi:hypothetical protein
MILKSGAEISKTVVFPLAFLESTYASTKPVLFATIQADSAWLRNDGCVRTHAFIT